MAELQHTNGSGSAIDTTPYVEFGQRYLTFAENTPYEVWSEVVGRLKSAEKSIQWWLGDALRFGERKYGEMYSQALEETDYAYGTLRNAAWVAGNIPPEEREDDVPFTHHQIVAPLPPEERRALLKECKPKPGSRKPSLTATELRERLHPHEEKVEVVKTRVCDKCGGTGEIVVEEGIDVRDVPQGFLVENKADGSRTVRYIMEEGE